MRRRLLAAISISSFCLTAHSATLIWDTGSASGAQDGSGTWNTSATNWFSAPFGRWTNSFSAPNTAVFGSGNGAAGLVTVSGGITVDDIIFTAPGSGNYTITGDILTLAGNPIITAYVDATISSKISGTVDVTKAGAATLYLQAGADGQSNAYTGTLTISAGRLFVGGGPNTFATDGAIKGTVLISNGAALLLGQSDVVASAARVIVNSGGIFDLNGFSETIGALAGSGSVVVSGGQTLAIDYATVPSFSTFAGTLSGSGSIQLRGTTAGTLTLSGSNTYTGATIIGNNTGTGPPLSGGFPRSPVLAIPSIADGGVASLIGMSSSQSDNLRFDRGILRYTGASATTDRGALIVHSGAIDVTSAATNLTITGSFAADGSADIASRALTKMGPGTLTLAGAGDNPQFTLNVTTGTVVLAKVSSPTVHAINSSGLGLVIGFARMAQLAGSGDDQIAPTADVQVDGILDFNGRNECFNGLSSGFGSGLIRNDAPGTLSTMTVGEAGGTSTFTGSIQDGAGTLALVKAGLGALTFEGRNTYTGGTTVNGGTLFVRNSNTSGSFRVNADAALGGDGTLGPIEVANAGIVTPGRDNGAVSVGTLTANALHFGSGRAFAYFDLGSTPAAASDRIHITNDLAFTDMTAITITGAGTSIAPGNYTLFTYDGTFTGNESHIAIDDPSHYRQTFTVIPTAATVGSVQLNVSGVAGALTWKGDDAANVWDVRNSANWDNAGTRDAFLQLDHVNFDDTGSALSAVALTGVLNPGSITVTNGIAKSYIFGGSGSLVGGATLTKSGAGTLTVANANTYSGGSFINEGVVRLGHIGALGTGGITVNGGTLDLNGVSQNNGVSVTIAGSGAGGSGALVNNGSVELRSVEGVAKLTLGNDAAIGGTTRWDVRGVVNGGTFALTKTGPNDIGWNADPATSLGNILITQGRLVLGNSNNLGASSTAVTVARNAELSMELSSQQTKPLILNGGALGVDDGSKTWGGSLTLQNDQVLNVVNTRSVTGSMNLTGKVSGPGGFEKIGPGVLQLANPANDYLGETRVTAGTLQMIGSGKLPTATHLTVDGILDLNGIDQTISGIGGSGMIKGNSLITPRLTVLENTNRTLYAEFGDLTLVKEGMGVLTLATDPTKQRTTSGQPLAIVNEGTLVLGRTGFSIWGGGERLQVGPGGIVQLSGSGDDQIDPDVDIRVDGILDFNGRNESFRGLLGSGTLKNTASGSTSRFTIGVNPFFGSTFTADFQGVIEDGDGIVGLTKTGSSTQILSGRSTYTGPTNLNSGILVVNGGISRSTTNIVGATLAGSGVLGPVNLGGSTMLAAATVSPGPTAEPSSTGTLSVSAFSTLPGTTQNIVQFDLRSVSALGENDLVAVAGDLNFNSPVTANVHLVDGFLAPGDYRLFTYGGTLIGAANLTVPGLVGFPGARQTFALDTANPGAILLRVTGNPASLTWVGDGNAATTPDRWDNFTRNWSGGEKFYAFDSVTFDDSGASDSPNVTIDQTYIVGGSVTVDNSLAHPYAFSGNGGIGGSGKLIKKGPGVLRLDTQGISTYSGGTIISDGTIISSGLSLGSGTITLGTQETHEGNIAFLRTGSATGLPPIVVAPFGTGSVTIGVMDTPAGAQYVFSGPITLNRPTTLLHSGAGTSVRYSGGIDGNVGTLTIAGGNRTILASNNAFSGNIAVRDNGTILELTGTVSSGTSVDVGAGAELHSSSAKIDALTGAGTVSGGFGLTIGSGNANGTFAGAISGQMDLTKIGTGTQTLSGNNIYTGSTNVNTGILVVTGSIGSSSQTTVAAEATLGGTGMIGNLAIASRGHLAPGPGIGTLSAKTLVWDDGGILDFQLGAENSSDMLSLGPGAPTMSSTGELLFDFHNTGEDESTYQLITSGFASSFAFGSFSYVNLSPGLTGSFQLTANSLQFVTIPEPNRPLLASAGLGTLAGFSRSRPRGTGGSALISPQPSFGTRTRSPRPREFATCPIAPVASEKSSLPASPQSDRQIGKLLQLGVPLFEVRRLRGE